MHTRAGPGRGTIRKALVVGSLISALFVSSGTVSAQAAPGAATPAPTPSPTPKPVTCTVPSGDALTIHWYPGSNDAAYGCGSTDAAQTNLGKPAVSYRASNQSVTASDASIDTDLANGFAITFSADRPKGSAFQGFGKNNGARFRPHNAVEDRFAIVVQPARGEWAVDRSFVVYVNPIPACSIQAARLDVDGRRGCKAIVNVKDGGTALKDAGVANCAAATERFCGRVTVLWTTFSALVSPGTIVGDVAKETRELDICTGFTDHDVETDADRKTLACKTVKVANESGVADPGQRRVSYHSAAGNSGASPGPSASPAAPAQTSFVTPRLAVRDVATGSPTPKPSGAQTGSGLLYDATGVLPLGNTARLSAALGRVDVSSLLGRLQQNYAAASKGLTGKETGSLIPDKGSLGCPKGSCADDSFATLDASFFEAVHAPFRRGVESQFARDQVDLKPVDFTQIPTVSYGAKLVGAPPHARIGLAWFRDIENVESGSALHAERDLGLATVGVSHVVANIDPAHDANVYRVDERLSVGVPMHDIGHTTNTVFGAVLPLTQDRSFQVYGRHGVVRRSGAPSSAHETLGVFSYSPTDGGPVIDAVGSQQRFFGAAGFRTIDLAYDPLATAYDPFVGTRSSFATVGYAHYDGAQNSDDPNIKLSVTGVRAWTGGVTRYNSVAIAALAKLSLSHHPFTLSATHARSNIAQSIFARIGATVKIPDAQGAMLVRNDSDSVSLGFHALGFDFSAGPSWSNVPAACTANGAPACPAKYSRAVAYSVKRDDTVFLDASMSLVPAQQAKFDQKTVPVNQLETKGVLAYQGWCTSGPRYQPALTYDSNISQDGSAFLPGHLIEARLDFGSPNARHVFRVSYKLVLDQSGSPVSQSQHGLFFGIATDSQSERFRNICPDVLKKRAADKQAVKEKREGTQATS